MAEPDAERLAAIVGAAVGDSSARVVSAEVSAAEYPHDAISTAGLHVVSGTAQTHGHTVEWSAFVKTLQHVRHWPLLGTLPPEVAEEMRRSFPWRAELDTRAQVLPVLPEGLRVPDTYYVDDLGDDRVAVWMENVDVDPTPWSVEDYARCAYLLGVLAARRTPDQPAGASDLPVGFAVRRMVEARLPMFTAVVADGCLWTSPAVRELVDADYHRDLVRLHDRLPSLLEEMDALPQTLPHGDATPANLLRPRGEPGVFVAIDWALGSPVPVGHDLGQLLVGGCEGDFVDPSMLPAIHAEIEPAYCRGLHDGGLEVPADAVRRGYVGGLACRTAPFTLPVAEIGEADERRGYLSRRAALGRFVLDLVLER